MKIIGGKFANAIDTVLKTAHVYSYRQSQMDKTESRSASYQFVGLRTAPIQYKKCLTVWMACRTAFPRRSNQVSRLEWNQICFYPSAPKYLDKSFA